MEHHVHSRTCNRGAAGPWHGCLRCPTKTEEVVPILAKLLILLALLCSTERVAHADYLFTWGGNSNLFQGSFEVTDGETQPNQFYYPLSLTNSISITDPNSRLFQWSASQPDVFSVSSSSPTFLFGITLYEPTPTGSLEVHAEYNSFQEWALAPGQSGTLLFSESGSWNIAYIPEPSPAAMLAVGAATWIFGRKRIFPQRKTP